MGDFNLWGTHDEVPETDAAARDESLGYQIMLLSCHIVRKALNKRDVGMEFRLMMVVLLPLNRCRWLAGDVVHHAINPIHLVHHAVADFGEHFVRQA